MSTYGATFSGQVLPLPVPAAVVTVTAFDAADWFPARSWAFTVNVYVVEGASPVTVADVPAMVRAFVEPLYTSYPVTPTLSVDAVQDNATPVVVTVPTFSPVGADGGVVSTTPAHVAPFRRQPVGSPDPLATNPNAAVAPAATVPL
jgi:hypothetical protein